MLHLHLCFGEHRSKYRQTAKVQPRISQSMHRKLFEALCEVPRLSCPHHWEIAGHQSFRINVDPCESICRRFWLSRGGKHQLVLQYERGCPEGLPPESWSIVRWNHTYRLLARQFPGARTTEAPQVCLPTRLDVFHQRLLDNNADQYDCLVRNSCQNDTSWRGARMARPKLLSECQ